jgi:hypothetical protein
VVKFPRSFALRLVLFLATAASWACHHSPAAPTSTTSTVTAVSVAGTAPAIGGTSQFTATATLSNGTTQDVTAQAVWQSSNPAVATVSGGLVTAVAAGTADISAQHQQVTGKASITVVAGSCVFAVSPTSFAIPMSGGTGTVTVTVTQGGNCSWTATSNSSFATITGGSSGIGNGSVTFSVTANSGSSRSGSLTVAGQTVTITQSQGACVTSVSPSSKSFPATGGTGTVTVTAPASCSWSVDNGGYFITTAPGAPGVGNGSVNYTVAPNATGAVRQAPIRIEGFSVDITQDVPTGTFLTFISDRGDYIGGGQTQVYMTPSTTFGTTVDAARNHVYVSTISSDGLYTYWWYLNLAAPQGQQLLPGTYENATRYPFQAPTVPGLDFSGSGRGCNVLSGRFVVLEAVYSASGTVDRFHATFEQHCEGATPALRGEVFIRP